MGQSHLVVAVAGNRAGLDHVIGMQDQTTLLPLWPKESLHFF